MPFRLDTSWPWASLDCRGETRSHRTREPHPASPLLQSVFRDGQPPGAAWPPPLGTLEPGLNRGSPLPCLNSLPAQLARNGGSSQTKQPNPPGPLPFFPWDFTALLEL